MREADTEWEMRNANMELENEGFKSLCSKQIYMLRDERIDNNGRKSG